MYLIGFTLEIYYDARSYERQIFLRNVSCSCVFMNFRLNDKYLVKFQ